jgi:hypothetical protein
VTSTIDLMGFWESTAFKLRPDIDEVTLLGLVDRFGSSAIESWDGERVTLSDRAAAVIDVGVKTFHLQGTANDHDQSSHAGSSGSPRAPRKPHQPGRVSLNISGGSEEARDLIRRATDTGTLDAYRTIHNVARGYEETANVLDAIDDDKFDTVRDTTIREASELLAAASAQAMIAEHFPETFKVLRQGSLDGVVAVSIRPLTYLSEQRLYAVDRADVLTYGEALLHGSFAEDELHVDGSSLRPLVDETFHLRGTANDHDQQSHAGSRVAPVIGQTVKKTLSAELTMEGDTLTDGTKAKILAQLETSLGITPDEGVMHLVDIAEASLRKGLPGRDWYETAAAEAIEAADGFGIDPEVAIAITAALSPGTPWDQNRRNAHDMMAAFADRDLPLDPAHIRNVNVWANRPDGSTGESNSEMRATAQDTFNTLYERDPKLAAVYLAKKSDASVGYSYNNFLKASELMVRNDPAAIDEVLAGTKVRSFYNNLRNPRGLDGDVTVDIHMQRAMANDTGSTTSQQKFDRSTSIGKRSSSITGSPKQDGAQLGAMPVMADIVRDATIQFNQANGVDLLPHQFQAVVWVEQISQYPPTRIKQILKGNEL